MLAYGRRAGFLILAGIFVAIVWRVGVAPAILGDFDPAAMPHSDRAVLSVGNVAVAVLFAAAQWLLVRLLRGSATERVARIGAAIGALSVVTATLGTLGLVWGDAASIGLNLYVALMGVAWALIGWATFAAFGGPLGWAALASGSIFAIAALAIFVGGAAIIFVMTVAAAPFGIALLTVRPLAARRPGRLTAREREEQRL